MKIIGFGHKKYVGKDCAARFLATDFKISNPGSCVVRRGFAWKLKDVCHQLYGWAGLKSVEYYDNNSEEKDEILPILGMSPREIWIDFGTTAVRKNVYENTWIDHLLQSVSADLLIIPDLRFYNEAQAIKDRGGVCIRIDRPDAPITNDVADDALNSYNHWDYIITNDGSLNEFHDKIITLGKEILK